MFRIRLSPHIWEEIPTSRTSLIHPEKQQKTMKNILSIGAVASALFAFAATSSATVVVYNFGLDAAQEVPTNSSPGTGLANVTLNTNTNLLTWDVSYQNLTNGLSAAHFHGPADFGFNAGVLVNMSPTTGATSGTIVGFATVTDTVRDHILDGLTYINLHTFADADPNIGFTGGEIRGQVIPEPGTYALMADLLALGGAAWFRRRKA